MTVKGARPLKRLRGDGDGGHPRHAGRPENKERSDYIFRLSGISCRLVTVPNGAPA